MKRFIFLFLAMFIVLMACQKENTITNIPYDIPTPQIEDTFVKYVDRFIAEGEKRGYTFTKDSLIVEFAELTDFCGIGLYNDLNSGFNKVRISSSSNCWEDRSDLEKENLMFHELGHAMLNRRHVSTFLPNGLVKSIMCTEVCDNFNAYGLYTLATRDYYLDELFDFTAPVPEWGSVKTKPTIISQDNFEQLDSNWRFGLIDEIPDSNLLSQRHIGEIEGLNYLDIESRIVLPETTFAAWGFTISNPNLPEGGALRLKVNVSTNDLTGTGGIISLFTFSGTNIDAPEQSARAIESSAITETFEGQDFTIKIPYFPSYVKNIGILLGMQGGTKGEIRFNEVELTYLE